MSKHILHSAFVLFLALGLASLPAGCFGRGFGGFGGGGFHGASFGGGSFDRSSFSGGSVDRSSFGGGSFDRSSYGGGEASRGSFDGGSFNRSSYGGGDASRSSYSGGSYDRSSYSSGSFDRSSYGGGGDSLSRGNLNSFLGLPTDGGMHATSGVSAHAYEGAGGTDVAHVSAGERGAAVTPYGAAAGGRYAGATAVKGPEGNTYVHTSEAGRGVAAGPNGVEAGHYDAGRTSVNGTTVAGHSYAGYGYGTRAWSPTYCHAQAVAGRGWFSGSGIYGHTWCVAHPWAWYPAGWTAAAWTAAAWTTATWADAAAWIGAAPQYYGYNYGDDITYQDNSVYYAGQNAGTSQQYYQEAANLASAGAAAPAADDAQWMTLGVFGLMPEGKKTPDMVFQLAVDKQGTIRGNYCDQVTQTNQPVTGKVDKKTQRVAWSVGSGKGIVVETGLYNLTQDQSTALVHFGPDKTQQELLVRMQEPSDEDSQAAGQ